MSKNKFFGYVRRFHLIPKLFCVVFAFIFWIYVMEVDSPDYEETFEDVSVTIVGASTLDNERSLSVFSGYDALVDVTVKGQKSVISRYSTEDIVVKVDVSGVKNSGLFTLDLHYDLPSGITFVESSVSSIDLFIDKRTTKNFPVVTDITGYKLTSDKYVLGDVSCDIENVTVTGPESRINEIDKAVVEKNLGGMELTQSLDTDGTIVLKDQYGEYIESRYIRFQQSTVVNIPVYVKEYKPLRCETVHGLFNSTNAGITIEPEQIRIQGDPAIVDRIEYISISDIDEKTIKEDDTITEYINIPDNVSLVAGEPTHATVKIDLASTFITKDIVVEEFEIINAGDRKVSVLDESLRITVVGERGAVNRVEPELVKITVDLANYTDISGVIKIPCNIAFDIPEGVGIVYEYGVYELRVEAE